MIEIKGHNSNYFSISHSRPYIPFAVGTKSMTSGIFSRRRVISWVCAPIVENDRASLRVALVRMLWQFFKKLWPALLIRWTWRGERYHRHESRAEREKKGPSALPRKTGALDRSWSSRRVDRGETGVAWHLLEAKKRIRKERRKKPMWEEGLEMVLQLRNTYGRSLPSERRKDTRVDTIVFLRIGRL